ncbi:sugar phosphate isomerase/epimerase family protein [Emticicia sp.]|uniref:sugar phosphate isomerase/epimerase family protein n=1 Tax=Emticicia sp. TaxID=1930953 RepID=UPI003750AB3B
MNRRDFLTQASILTASSFLSLEALAAKSKFKIAYSAITWSGNDLVAISDIAALGFKGIQLRANTYAPFKDKPQDLKDTLDKNKLSLAMFSSGNVSIQNDISKDIETHLNHAKFIKALGGKSLQITNTSRPKDRLPTTEELKKYAKNMSEVAKVVKGETGIQPSYHNHMGQLGETPEEVDIIFNEMNHDYILALLDVAHYKQGGGNPAEAVIKYKDILYATHIKDTKVSDGKSGYQFVELGQGRVDFPAVFNALEKIKFKGWNIIELDAVPVKGRTALECGQTSKKYLESINVKF